jgi:alkylation response protein AidB-like acyl-CoA dehydrogenase
MAEMTVIWQPELDADATRWRDLAARVTAGHFAPLAEEIDREQRYPWENVRRLVEHKLAGLFIPKPYGGEGASLTATAAVVEAIGAGCSSTAAILCVYQLGAFLVLLAGRGPEGILSRRDGQGRGDELRALGARRRFRCGGDRSAQRARTRVLGARAARNTGR